MRRRPRRQLLIAVAAAAVAAGVALAITRGSSHGGHGGPHGAAKSHAAGPAGELTIAAEYLGITRTQLRHRLHGATLGQIADATPGRSRRGLEQALLSARSAEWKSHGVPAAEQAARAARLRARIRAAVLRPIAAGDLGAAARYLAIPEAELRGELLRGRSLAALAGSRAGTSRTGLIATILAARRSRLQAALAARSISAKVEQAELAGLPRRIAREVDRTLSGG